MILVPMLFLLAIGLVVYGGSQLREASRLAAGPALPAAPPVSSARQILDERYARGEIDTDTYLHQVETLRRASELATAPIGTGAGDGEAARPEQQV